MLLRAIILVCIFLNMAAYSSAAEQITIDQPLDFGEFAANFSVNSSLQVGHTGSVMTSGTLHVITSPQAARLSLSGYPPSTAMTVSIADFFLTRGGGSDTFLVTNFVHSTLVTDTNGDAQLSVGATLFADAGKSYPDTTYNGSMDIHIIYP